MTDPIRLTLASPLDDTIGGAWWPYSPSIARELPGLIERLREPLGQVLDLGINWTPLQGVLNLDQFGRNGITSLTGHEARHHRVITVTGTLTQAHLLVVPSDTTRGLAVMVLRCAANLPVRATHQHTNAFRTAELIVGTARAQHATSAIKSDAGTTPA